MEVRAKKALGQHFLVDQGAAQRIVAALNAGPDAKKISALEIGPGMGVLTQYLLKREDVDLKMVELDEESVNYLLTHFPGMQGRLFLADYLKLNINHLFSGPYSVIGNFPYNISSQIFFKILDDRDRIPEVVCMIQKEVAERIAEGPGSKTYGILSVLLQAWYDIEYLFTVEPGAFAPPPKVRSAVIRLRRNGRTSLTAAGLPLEGVSTPGHATPKNGRFSGTPIPTLREGPDGDKWSQTTQDTLGGAGVKGAASARTESLQGQPCRRAVDEGLFKSVVKTAFNQRRKTLRNALKPLLNPESEGFAEFIADPVFDLRAERLSVEDFIALTAKIAGHLKG